VVLPELLKRVNEDFTNLVFGVLLVAIMVLSGRSRFDIWRRARGLWTRGGGQPAAGAGPGTGPEE
jgi:hypothetical protein